MAQYANRHAADVDQAEAPILSMVLHSHFSPGVRILTEAYLLVTPNPFSTRWSPPVVLNGVVLMTSA